jgi:transcriptional regulator with XRE-family HTH domain
VLPEQEKLPPETVSQFAQQLRTLREAQGLSLRDLAALTGVSTVTIWKWEKGDSKPRARSLPSLAQALHVSPSSLAPIASASRALKIGPEKQEPEAPLADQAEPDVPGPGTPASFGHPEVLADVIARAKQMIAEASGTGPNNITILIEY